MTVRFGGELTFGQGDFVRTDRGITWGVKVTDTGDLQFIYVFIKRADGTWGLDDLAESQIDVSVNDTVNSQYGGDTNRYFKEFFIPRLNAWLAKKFPAMSNPVPTKVSEQVDYLINNAMRVTVKADGTISVAAI